MLDGHTFDELQTIADARMKRINRQEGKSGAPVASELSDFEQLQALGLPIEIVRSGGET